MNNLYYGSDHAGDFRDASFTFDMDVLQTFLRRIYNGFDTSNDFEPTMWREVLRIINEGTVQGLSNGNYPFDTKVDKTFLQKIAHSNEVFSAFKVHDMGVLMAKKLKDSEGNLRSFAEWKKEIQPIASHHCGAWLNTEYNTAILRAQFAAEWKQYEADADIFPNLRWMPTTSATPDEEHKVYWSNRLTLPIGDKFWNDHHPGDHWNCKCSLEQTDEPSNGEVLKHVQEVKAQPGLKANPGKDGVIFDKTHPYFAESCSKCPFRGSNGLKNIFTNEGKHCNSCSKMDKKLKEYLSKKKDDYHKYRDDPKYTDVVYDKKTGGVKARHVGHIEHSRIDEPTFFGGMTSSDLERECQNELFHMGRTVVLCDESKRKRGNRLPALDMSLDNRLMDVRSITGRGWYSLALIQKNEQLIRFNKRTDIEEKADTTCLYFHDSKMFSMRNLKKSINYFRHKRTKDGKEPIQIELKHVVCVIKGSKEIIEFDI